MKTYSWVTSDIFDTKLRDIVASMRAEEILDLPGVYEIVSEYLNNEVLKALEFEHDESSAEEEETRG
jgi:hypothetical protein